MVRLLKSSTPKRKASPSGRSEDADRCHAGDQTFSLVKSSPLLWLRDAGSQDQDRQAHGSHGTGWPSKKKAKVSFEKLKGVGGSPGEDERLSWLRLIPRRKPELFTRRDEGFLAKETLHSFFGESAWSTMFLSLFFCSPRTHPKWSIGVLEDDGGEAYAVSQETGMKHLSVTLDPNGLAPSFPCPESQLRHAR